jgi:hypothetical protein
MSLLLTTQIGVQGKMEFLLIDAVPDCRAATEKAP